MQGKHIKTVAVINKMGTYKNHALNKRAQQICGFCQQFQIWITASHIPGKENFEAALKLGENIKMQSGC